MKNFQRIVIGILAVLLLVVAVQAMLPEPEYVPGQNAPQENQACIGQPIRVDYVFSGGFLDPWACEVQCSDNQPRYVLYSNGQATQCETPPGCNDAGEDSGVTCIPPSQSVAS